MLKEIDRLYQTPEIVREVSSLRELNTPRPEARDQLRVLVGDTSVRAVYHGRSSYVNYPSGAEAGEAEKRGVMKWLAHRILGSAKK